MTPVEDRAEVVSLINEALDNGAGLIKACKQAGIDRRTYHRWLDRATGEIRKDGRPEAKRPRPPQALTLEEREAVLLTCQLPEFADRPPSQIVPSLADQGIYLASESSMYRILHDADQQHERGRASRRSKAVKTTHHTDGPNQCWCWDVTYLASPVRGLFYYLYMIVDIWSRKIVGWEVYESETGELASELMTRAVLAEGCRETDLVLHADNGGPQKSATLRATLDKLGVTRSFSRPRVSDDNAYSESLFRTTKYRHDFPVDGFESIDVARTWVLGFVRWYNEEHHHSAIKFVSPGQRHRGEDKALLAKRREVYEAARARNPARWSGATRNWTPPSIVTLNPDRKSPELENQIA
jgi:putative transposase